MAARGSTRERAGSLECCARTPEAGSVLLPHPDPATLDPVALFLTVLAAASLLWWKRGMFQTLAICAAAGGSRFSRAR
ncbi:hypothetical protein C7U60_04325 [Mesorhizobium plurifarium]|nr:hypothetical protein C7U60_04325 [Mesorhizobium plurifarium]